MLWLILNPMLSTVPASDPPHPTTLAWVRSLQAKGIYTFTHEDATQALGRTSLAVSKALHRLVHQNRLVVPRQGLYVIVPAEFDLVGAPPASWFIHDLMAYLRHPYYVGLLTAAGLHGAAPQAAQVFQVVTDAAVRPIQVGRTRIEFSKKTSFAATPIAQVKTLTGLMAVSTPEATALDLVRYYKSAGHLAHVATVLADLAEHMDTAELARAATAGDFEMSVVQRLGHLLDSIGHSELTDGLARLVEVVEPRPTVLRPDLPDSESVFDHRWRIRVNEHVEVDE
jgi:predicted transcriptional regulator of viral defense system